MIFKDKKMRITIIIFLLIFIIQIGIFIGNSIKAKNQEPQEENNLSIKTESNIFKIDSILLYSSANAINNSSSETKWDLSVYQYTDIAIKINNMVSSEELTNKNTIKEIYIDNFSFPSAPLKGTPLFYYKNPTKFGVANINDEYEIGKSIIYNVTTKNEEVDFTKPTFYTDCSNPLTLSYVNKNVEPNLTLDNNNETIVTFDGNLLRDSSILLSSLDATVSFTIHIKNYLDEEFTCDVVFDIPLQDETKDIYSGSYTKEVTKLHSSKFYKLGK